MNQLAKKLQIKNDHIGRLLGLPKAVEHLFSDWPDELTASAGTELNFILAFVANQAELRRHAADCVESVVADGLIWIAYPKKSSGIKTDIHRDCGWLPFDELGYRPVRQISIDETWSALRFRKKELVK